jgi:hypothetical protein
LKLRTCVWQVLEVDVECGWQKSVKLPARLAIAAANGMCLVKSGKI